jgi:hypothetical protein
MAGVLSDGQDVGEIVGARTAGADERSIADQLHIQDGLVGCYERVPLVAGVAGQAIEASLASATAGQLVSVTTIVWRHIQMQNSVGIKDRGS